MMDKDVKRIVISKSSKCFIVEIEYTNSKIALFTVDGYKLDHAFDAINRQNKEVHRAVA